MYDDALFPCAADTGGAWAQQLRSRLVDKLAEHVLPPISKVEMFLTENCTMGCDYCFVAGKSASKRMSWTTAQKAIDFLFAQSGEVPIIQITFFGGEPLLEFDMMKRIAEYAEGYAASTGKRIEYAVTTNGTIMSEEIVQFGQQRRLNLLLSIDGCRTAHDRHRRTRDGHGTWDVVTGANFKLLKRLQRWVGTRITVNPDTVDELYEGVCTLYEMGVNQFIVGANMDAEWTPEALHALSHEMRLIAEFYVQVKEAGGPIRITEFEETLKSRKSRFTGLWGCDAGRTRMAIATDGALYPCARFVSPSPGTKGLYCLGNVDEGLTESYTRAEVIDNRNERRPACAACELADYCSGGCPAVNLHTSGSIYGLNAISCHSTRMLTELLPIVAPACVAKA